MITNNCIFIIRYFGSHCLLLSSTQSHLNSQLHQNFEICKNLTFGDLNIDLRQMIFTNVVDLVQVYLKPFTACRQLQQFSISQGGGAEINPPGVRVWPRPPGMRGLKIDISVSIVKESMVNELSFKVFIIAYLIFSYPKMENKMTFFFCLGIYGEAKESIGCSKDPYYSRVVHYTCTVFHYLRKSILCCPIVLSIFPERF